MLGVSIRHVASIGVAGIGIGYIIRKCRRAAVHQERFAASPQGVLHFSFSGTGTQFFAWMMGFASELRKSGMLTKQSTFYGVSGGAHIAAFLAVDVDMSEQSELFEATVANSEKAKRKDINLKDMVRNVALSVLDENSVARVNKRLHVAAVGGQGHYFSWIQRGPTLFSTFTDLADLMGALLASTHIPYVVDGNKSTVFRGEEYLDYGLWGQLFVPVQGAVTVNAYPPQSWHGPMPGGSWLSQWLVSNSGASSNAASAPVDVHPWLVPDWWRASRIFCWDDCLFNPLPRELLLERHRLGREAFHIWNSSRKDVNK